VGFKYSRLWCDVERFRDDSEEFNSQHGHGVVYTHGAMDNKIREVSEEKAEQIKQEYYDKHHEELNLAVNRALSFFKKVVLVDCHSFPNIRLIYEKYEHRPDFCLGTDAFYTPEELVIKLSEYLKSLDFSVAINIPYSGTMVPLEHLGKTEKLKAIMIEVNRDLYLKEPGLKNNRFDEIKGIVSGALNIEFIQYPTAP
jgi:N-formylglutamate amidohydrolase